MERHAERLEQLVAVHRDAAMRAEESLRNATGAQESSHAQLLASTEASLRQSRETLTAVAQGFAERAASVTDEQRAAGEFPNQHEGGAGLPSWTSADRDLDGADVLVHGAWDLTGDRRASLGVNVGGSSRVRSRVR